MTLYSLPLVPGDVIDVIATTPTPPTPPAPSSPSPLGMCVTDAGKPIYDQQGNAYALLGPPPTQIVLTPAGGSPVTVSSSAAVTGLTVTGVTAANPSGVVQINTSLAVWSVAQTNTAGRYLGAVAGPPMAYSPPTAPGPAEPYPDLPAATFKIDDWSPYLMPARQGSGSGFASTIPTPGGGIPFEPSNPETQFYADPTVPGGYQPFSLGAGNSIVITAIPGTTPGTQQTYLSGVLASAGSGGTFFAGGPGVFSTRTRMTKGLNGGMWPADWYLPIEGPFNYFQGCEYDAMEWWAAMSQFHQGIAGGADSFEPNLSIYPGYTVGGWHNYTAIFGPQTTQFYVDGICTISTPTAAGMNGKHLALLMDIAVGKDQTWAGTPPANGQTFQRETSMFHYYPLPPGFA